MPRKGENIYRRKDGRLEGRYLKGHSNEGKALYGYVYGKTYAEVKQKRLERLAELSNRCNVPKPKIPSDKAYCFSTLTEEWLETVRPQVKQSTYNKYRNLIESYILPEFDGMQLPDLTAEALRHSCNHMLEHGGKKNNGLSSKTVGDVLSLIRRLLSYASGMEWPIKCSGKEFSIKQTSKEMNILCRSEQEILCRYLLQHRDMRNIGIFLCLFTGLRVGEICALKWEDISLKEGTVYIHQIIQRVQTDQNPDKKTEVLITTPKSKCSVRTIPIPSNVIQILQETDIPRKGYLVTGTEQRYLEPRTMQNHFKRILERADLRPVNFHALRHPYVKSPTKNFLPFLKFLSGFLCLLFLIRTEVFYLPAHLNLIARIDAHPFNQGIGQPLG